MLRRAPADAGRQHAAEQIVVHRLRSRFIEGAREEEVAMLDSLRKDDELLANIQARWSELADLLEEVSSHWVYEDLVYRFYHQSFKVYALQTETTRIVAALK